MNFFIQWIDLVWLFLGWAVAPPRQRWSVMGFVVLNMIMMRLMAELMESIHHTNGIMGLMPTSVRARGQGVYAFYYVVYLLFAIFSPNRDRWLFMGVSLTIFFAAALTFSVAMVL